jgi:predicted methyltransferase
VNPTAGPAVVAPVVDFAQAASTVVAASDRAETDRKLDAGRHPAELLAFLQLPAGARVAEISAGTGYTTELLARAVGPTGTVYGQNNAFVIEKFAAAGWAERLAKPINKNVVRVDRELDAPLPKEASQLDSVVNVLFYHDTVWMKTDRAKMNSAIFEALRPGGTYVVVDHAAAAGHGIADVSSLHRIDEQTVRSEIQAAGFEVAAEATFLRNAADQRDWNASPGQAGDKRGSSDRFVVKFVKPIK